MGDLCCLSNCENEPGAGTHLSFVVPQVGTSPMVVTMPVCEEHWPGNWRRERRQLEAENARLRHVLSAITALASGEAGAG